MPLVDHGRRELPGDDADAGLSARGGPVKIRLHGTEEECREGLQVLEEIMLIQSVRGPYQDRQRSELERSVLVQVYVEEIRRGGG